MHKFFKFFTPAAFEQRSRNRERAKLRQELAEMSLNERRTRDRTARIMARNAEIDAEDFRAEMAAARSKPSAATHMQAEGRDTRRPAVDPVDAREWGLADVERRRSLQAPSDLKGLVDEFREKHPEMVKLWSKGHENPSRPVNPRVAVTLLDGSVVLVDPAHEVPPMRSDGGPLTGEQNKYLSFSGMPK